MSVVSFVILQTAKDCVNGIHSGAAASSVASPGGTCAASNDTPDDGGGATAPRSPSNPEEDAMEQSLRDADCAVSKEAAHQASKMKSAETKRQISKETKYAIKKHIYGNSPKNILSVRLGLPARKYIYGS